MVLFPSRSGPLREPPARCAGRLRIFRIYRSCSYGPRPPTVAFRATSAGFSSRVVSADCLVARRVGGHWPGHHRRCGNLFSVHLCLLISSISFLFPLIARPKPPRTSLFAMMRRSVLPMVNLILLSVSIMMLEKDVVDWHPAAIPHNVRIMSSILNSRQMFRFNCRGAVLPRMKLIGVPVSVVTFLCRVFDTYCANCLLMAKSKGVLVRQESSCSHWSKSVNDSRDSSCSSVSISRSSLFDQYRNTE